MTGLDIALCVFTTPLLQIDIFIHIDCLSLSLHPAQNKECRTACSGTRPLMFLLPLRVKEKVFCCAWLCVLKSLSEYIHFDAAVFPLSLAFVILLLTALVLISCTHVVCLSALSSITNCLTRALGVHIYACLWMQFESHKHNRIHGRVKRVERLSERILSTLVKALAGWHTHRRWLKGCYGEVWQRIFSAFVKVWRLDMQKATHRIAHTASHH